MWHRRNRRRHLAVPNPSLEHDSLRAWHDGSTRGRLFNPRHSRAKRHTRCGLACSAQTLGQHVKQSPPEPSHWRNAVAISPNSSLGEPTRRGRGTWPIEVRLHIMTPACCATLEDQRVRHHRRYNAPRKLLASSAKVLVTPRCVFALAKRSWSSLKTTTQVWYTCFTRRTDEPWILVCDLGSPCFTTIPVHG